MSSQPGIAGPRANVLLVDDQPANLLALESILAGLGQNLVGVTSGTDALRRVLDEDFAVILMDVKMPGMDGIEAAAMIRGRERSQHTPIIFLTAFEQSDPQVFEGYSLGAVDYLFKPIQPEVLRSKVSVFVELDLKTKQIKLQEEQLRRSQRCEMERRMAEDRQRWEMERLREEAVREKKAAEALTEADRRKDEFLAMLAHELRNPLAPILTSLELIRSHGRDPEAAEKAREIVERQVRHMARLIDDLLDVSRITRGKIQLRKEVVELAEVVGQAIEGTAPLLRARRHELTVTLPPEPLRLDADPTRLAQVLSNLLNNAAKYTEPGGRIDLTASRAGDEVVITVRDTGVGIPPDMMERVFELFTQVDRSLTSDTQWGLGIGLALVQELVTMHGGSIRARSEGPGRGSEFECRLPLAGQAAAHEPTPDPRPEQGGRGAPCPNKRILVVDDNTDAVESLAALLRLGGHEVFTAGDGEAALAAVAEHNPEVVLLDIGLPKIDGYEVASRLRRVEDDRGLILIAMTGYGQDDDRRRSREAGFDCHLVKPLDPDSLQELLACPDRIPRAFAYAGEQRQPLSQP